MLSSCYQVPDVVFAIAVAMAFAMGFKSADPEIALGLFVVDAEGVGVEPAALAAWEADHFASF